MMTSSLEVCAKILKNVVISLKKYNHLILFIHFLVASKDPAIVEALDGSSNVISFNIIKYSQNELPVFNLKNKYRFFSEEMKISN